MFLLRPQTPIINISGANTFTFQYVSIKTNNAITPDKWGDAIYIPICFY